MVVVVVVVVVMVVVVVVVIVVVVVVVFVVGIEDIIEDVEVTVAWELADVAELSSCLKRRILGLWRCQSSGRLAFANVDLAVEGRVQCRAAA